MRTTGILLVAIVASVSAYAIESELPNDPSWLRAKIAQLESMLKDGSQTTLEPATQPPTTQPPTTKPPKTAPPTTQPPKTAPPTTQPPKTAPPTTQPPTTAPPTTQPPKTAPPTTQPPKTEPPTTQPPKTAPPTTQPPTTAPPTTQPPKTAPPTTKPPKTAPPTTQPPITKPATTVPPTTQPTTQSPTDKCNAIFSCSDCNTARVCRPTATGFAEVKKIACPSTAPYCDYNTGTCASTPDATCGATDNEFLCLQDGVFPDFKDSSVYHVCESLTATKFECDVPGENFNAIDSSCATSESFTTFTCKDTGKKAPYNIESSYYGYCSVAGGQPTVIDKCPGSYQLNVTSQECEAICRKPGVLPYNDDCSKYYKCHYLWITNENPYLMRTLETCPPHTTFSADDFVCVNENSNPNCPKK